MTGFADGMILSHLLPHPDTVLSFRNNSATGGADGADTFPFPRPMPSLTFADALTDYRMMVSGSFVRCSSVRSYYRGRLDRTIGIVVDGVAEMIGGGFAQDLHIHSGVETPVYGCAVPLGRYFSPVGRSGNSPVIYRWAEAVGLMRCCKGGSRTALTDYGITRDGGIGYGV